MSFFDILPWWSWLTGTVGLVGLVALFLFAPAVAGQLLNSVITLLERLLQTRIGVAIVVGALAFGVGYVYGFVITERKCDAAIEDLKVRAEAAGKTRDAAVLAEAEKRHAPAIEAMQKQADELQIQVADYERKIMAAASGQCPLGDEPLRLRRRK